MSRAGKIFVSYRREDTQHVAGRLFDALNARYGAGNVFMDVDSIRPGLDFREVIADAVDRCDVMFSLIGTNWLSCSDPSSDRRRLDTPDDLVRLEVTSAINRGIRVIPILVDGAGAPRADELPAELEPVAYRNSVRLDHATFHDDLARLVKTLDTIEPKEGRPVRQPRPRTDRPPARRKRITRHVISFLVGFIALGFVPAIISSPAVNIPVAIAVGVTVYALVYFALSRAWR